MKFNDYVVSIYDEGNCLRLIPVKASCIEHAVTKAIVNIYNESISDSELPIDGDVLFNKLILKHTSKIKTVDDFVNILIETYPEFSEYLIDTILENKEEIYPWGDDNKHVRNN